MLETAPLLERRRAGAAARNEISAVTQNPALVRWGAHAVFWGGYLLARTAAAQADDGVLKPELAGFPFLLNRSLVIATYAVLTGAVLAAVFLLRRPEQKRYANLAIVAGSVLAIPFGQHAEEFWPSFLTGEPPGELPLIGYVFEMGWVLPLWGLSQALVGYHLDVLEHARDADRARALAYDAQLKALHYQINPHFLFNTLNAISTLVLESRQAQAEGMLMHLSAFLRYSLERNPTDTVSLAEELDAQRQYLAIEQTRFGDRLVVSFDVDPATAEAKVPSLILQPILENAIKHALSPQTQGLHVRLCARREDKTLRICVEDDGPGLSGPPSRRGLGLANTRERLGLLYGERAGLGIANKAAGTGCIVDLHLPFEVA